MFIMVKKDKNIKENNMKYFLDIVDVFEICCFNCLGIVDGVIINLIIILCEGCDFKEVINEIC